MEQMAFTVSQFCRSHQMSRAFFYQLVKEGRAPRVIKLGSKRLISIEEAKKWRERIENETAEVVNG